jgi:ATP-dependent RNA helicase RhlE
VLIISNQSFQELLSCIPLMHGILAEGYAEPTDIQQKVIPAILAGRDVIAAAPTGTGKTAAYLLPIVQKLVTGSYRNRKNRIKVLVIVPTKELVIQTRNFLLPLVADLSIRISTAFGGVGISPQIQEIRKGTDIIISTPGRFKELLERKTVFLDELQILVIDEIDHMLQMGFIEDLDAIVSHINSLCQSLFFSATISVPIAKLAGRILKNPLTIDVKAVNAPAALSESIKSYVLFSDKGRKRKLLLWLLKDQLFNKILIFTNTKTDAERIGKDLGVHNFPVAVLHGDKSNKDRQLIMDRFNRGRITILVATDLVSRGFDIEDISYVVHFNIPKDIETYLHRSGRTGRIGKKGTVYSLCDQFDRHGLHQIQQGMTSSMETFSWHPFHSEKVMLMDEKEAQEKALTARLKKNEPVRKITKKTATPKPVEQPVPNKKIKENANKNKIVYDKRALSKQKAAKKKFKKKQLKKR